jgi:hypothetical protein
VAGKTVIITNQPYFYKKAEVLPDSTFIIGADTAARLIDVSIFGCILLMKANSLYPWVKCMLKSIKFEETPVFSILWN